MSVYPQYTSNWISSSVSRGITAPGTQFFLPIEYATVVRRSDEPIDDGMGGSGWVYTDEPTDSKVIKRGLSFGERQRVDLFDVDGQCRSASRSTTTCVSGRSKRSRARSTTPRSSQCDRPGGCVETIS